MEEVDAVLRIPKPNVIVKDSIDRMLEESESPSPSVSMSDTGAYVPAHLLNSNVKFISLDELQIQFNTATRLQNSPNLFFNTGSIEIGKLPYLPTLERKKEKCTSMMRIELKF